MPGVVIQKLPEALDIVKLVHVIASVPRVRPLVAMTGNVPPDRALRSRGVRKRRMIRFGEQIVPQARVRDAKLQRRQQQFQRRVSEGVQGV